MNERTRYLHILTALEQWETLWDEWDEDQRRAVKRAIEESNHESKKPCPSCGQLLSVKRKPTLHLEYAEIHGDMSARERNRILAEW